ncbi:MAG: D-2-hydroxyacid dehydrogenase family protein [Chloroflexi bacterium]|nr:D-2-hydroxyacid dehydrogenase family protein [Chloroflexota bacterium]
MRIAILDDYQHVALQSADWRAVEARADVTVYADHIADEVALAERLRDAEIVVAMRERTPFPRSLFERLPNLRLLITTGMGNAAFDMAAAREHGVTVCGTGGLGYPTAELTWALILALARRVPAEHEAIRAGHWQTTLGEGLNGKTLGVIGLGRLGGQVATVGKAFGMDVIAWSQNLTRERSDALGVALAGSLDELLERSDFASIHLVLSARTRRLIGAAQLGRMRPSAYLVNTSRGPIVDEVALIEALRTHSIAGAGLDVFDVEPLPAGNPLIGLENVVLTPHLGYVTKETYDVFYGDAVEDVIAFLDGAPVRVLGG